MKKILCLLILGVMSLISPSHADVTCVKKKVPVQGGEINLGTSIKRFSGITCPAAYKKLVVQDDKLVAYIKIGSVAMQSLGGSKVTSANYSYDPINGIYSISFTGDFSDHTNLNDYIVSSTAISSNYGVSNGYVSSVTDTVLNVIVYVWRSDNTTDYNTSGVFVSVLQGKNATIWQ